MSLSATPDPAVPYRDRKRSAWTLSLLVPALVALGPVLWLAWPRTLMLWLPVIFVHGIAPLIDLALGADTSNPPEEAVPALEADAYYRRVTYALVPLLWAAFICGAWFCMRMFSNWAVFHLQRHSDHHAHPMRRYQSLRHFDDLPQLPNGYFGMFTVAYVPPLWFALMDARLVKAVHSDASRINFAPGRRAALVRRHGLVDVQA